MSIYKHPRGSYFCVECEALSDPLAVSQQLSRSWWLSFFPTFSFLCFSLHLGFLSTIKSVVRKFYVEKWKHFWGDCSLRQCFHVDSLKRDLQKPWPITYWLTKALSIHNSGRPLINIQHRFQHVDIVWGTTLISGITSASCTVSWWTELISTKTGSPEQINFTMTPVKQLPWWVNKHGGKHTSVTVLLYKSFSHNCHETFMRSREILWDFMRIAWDLMRMFMRSHDTFMKSHEDFMRFLKNFMRSHVLFSLQAHKHQNAIWCALLTFTSPQR